MCPDIRIVTLLAGINAAVAGIIESLLSVIIYQLTSDNKQRSMAIAYVYTGFSLTAVIGAPLGTIIADHFRWQDAFIMVAIITLIATLAVIFLLPRDLPGENGHYKDQLALQQIWFNIIFVLCTAATLSDYYTYIRPLIR